MQLSRARTSLDSLFHTTTPGTPQFLHAAAELCGYAPPVRDPLSGYPPLPQLPAANAVSYPSSSSSGSFIFGGPDGSPPPPEYSSSSYSSLSFRCGCSPLLSGSSILSFDHGAAQFEDYAAFADAFEHADDQINLKCSFDDTADRSVGLKDGEFDDQQFSWIYSNASAARGTDPNSPVEPPTTHKRHRTGGEVQQPSKKHCGGSQKKAKSKPSASKDPQSIAAKNRRERISERLKILQDLVPNGTKVDLVTMLEKAISYVKFLQLQVKVLSTDELWPSQGGKAPEISQVRDVIDSILSSHRERTCSGL